MPAEQSRRAEEEARVAEQRRIEEFEDAQQRTALEAEREQEAQRIAEKFRLAREARERNREISLNSRRSDAGAEQPRRSSTAPATAPDDLPAARHRARRHAAAPARLRRQRA